MSAAERRPPSSTSILQPSLMLRAPAELARVTARPSAPLPAAAPAVANEAHDDESFDESEPPSGTFLINTRR